MATPIQMSNRLPKFRRALSALPGVLAFSRASGCRSAAEQARTTIDAVYRAAKALDGQLSAGAELSELRVRQGNLATEPGILHDRMKSDPSVATLMQKYFAAYDSVLQSYSLSTDRLEYDRMIDACIAPRVDEPVSSADFEKVANFLRRIIDFNEKYRVLDISFRQRADALGMQCPEAGFDSKCLVKLAKDKLSAAESLVLGRKAVRPSLPLKTPQNRPPKTPN